jgi:hypothetical protein
VAGDVAGGLFVLGELLEAVSPDVVPALLPGTCCGVVVGVTAVGALGVETSGVDVGGAAGVGVVAAGLLAA